MTSAGVTYYFKNQDQKTVSLIIFVCELPNVSTHYKSQVWSNRRRAACRLDLQWALNANYCSDETNTNS